MYTMKLNPEELCEERGYICTPREAGLENKLAFLLYALLR